MLLLIYFNNEGGKSINGENGVKDRWDEMRGKPDSVLVLLSFECDSRDRNSLRCLTGDTIVFHPENTDTQTPPPTHTTIPQHGEKHGRWYLYNIPQKGKN